MFVWVKMVGVKYDREKLEIGLKCIVATKWVSS